MEDIFLEKKDLEELLKKKKMLEYERYKDYDIYDLFIDLLKDETIYNYGNFNNDIMKAGLEDKIGRLQDKCIITEDNNRYEEFEDIAKDILTNFDKKCEYVVIPDRKDAIKYAIENGKKGNNRK